LEIQVFHFLDLRFESYELYLDPNIQPMQEELYETSHCAHAIHALDEPLLFYLQSIDPEN
jgi:hypothetical protein